tara:strand:+ start:1395 stop:1577 length:183 start_codon:yes stop_codon:yes gene_type:complete
MPIKFKRSQVIKDRATGKLTTQHFYMKQTPTSELEQVLNNPNASPKLRIKCKRELIRRNK